MAKNKEVSSNLDELSQGILENLESNVKEVNNKEVNSKNINNSNQEISNSDEMQNSNNEIKDNTNIVNTEKSNNINNNSIIKSKRVKKESTETKEKNKRSFMLNDTAVQQLKMLNLALDDKDLGTIVIDAIDLYYRKNEKKVESYITDMFNSLKK